MTAILRSLHSLGNLLGLFWLLLLLAGLVLLIRRKWSGGLALLMLAALLSLLGNTYFAKSLIATLELPYASVSLAQLPTADAVVVLGGGFWPSAHDAFQLGFGEASERAITGLELMRQHTAGALVLGGGLYPVGKTKLNALELMREWLAAWKINDAPLFCLEKTLNTHAEAQALRTLAGQKHWKKILLVTSAAHLRRAVATFRHPDLEVIGVPCDYLGAGVPNADSPWTPIPDRHNLLILDSYLHEKIGWWIYRWNGWLTDPATAIPNAVTSTNSTPAL
jgi:uncharacterized SAM-binding protein YcdF (DUF218 family)